MSQAQLLPADIPQFVFRLTFETWHTNRKTGVSAWNRIGKIHYYSSDENGNPPDTLWKTANAFVAQRHNRHSYGPVRPVVQRYALHADISEGYPNGNLSAPVGSTP